MALTPGLHATVDGSGLPVTGSDLEVRGVSHAYGGVPALEGVDLTVPAGGLAVLLGPSGCGKSTLLRMIAGLEVPDRGTVVIGGAERTGRPGNVGLVFQEASLYPWLTVAGNAAFGLRVQGYPRREVPERVAAVLELVRLTDAAHLYPSQLSGGMAQRAALARALAAFPGVLLLDEPFGSVDLYLRSRLQDEVIRLWRATGCTIVLVTHSVDEAVLVGERVLLMSPSPGRLAGDIAVTLPYPRDPRDPAFLLAREEIFERGRSTHYPDRPEVQ